MFSSELNKVPFLIGVGVLAFVTIGGTIYIWMTRNK
jgi:hypothetical protein